MTGPYLEYKLQDGYVHNWLVAGPQVFPVVDLDYSDQMDFQRKLARRYRRPDSGVPSLEQRGQSPQERETIELDGQTVTWHYARCMEDHLLDLADRYPTCQYLRSWAYAELASPHAQDVTLALTSYGPIELWLNGQHLLRRDHFSGPIPESVPVSCTLRAGMNQILVRLEQVAVGTAPYAFALRLAEVDAENVAVRVPSCNQEVDRRYRIERMVEAAYIERELYAGEEELRVHWPEELDDVLKVTVRVQKPTGEIFAEARPDAQAGATQVMLRAYELPSGYYHVRVMSDVLEYYLGDRRYARDLGVYVLGSAHAETSRGTLGDRARAALEHAQRQRESLYAEIAKMALNSWSHVDTEVIGSAVERVNARHEDSVVDLLGLLAILYRYAERPAFPSKLVEPLKACVLGYRYWEDEPGTDAMAFRVDSAAILFHTCQILAGQLYPGEVFANAGKTGEWNRRLGQRRALSRLSKRAQLGFSEWDSSWAFERYLLGLVHLLDLGQNPDLRELAAVIMDKVLFTLAVNSFKGVFGSTHGGSHGPILTDGRLEPTAGVSKMLWGMGCHNPLIAATVGLACSEEYELPTILQDIATHFPDEMWARERHAWQEERPAPSTEEVNKVTYKTPDYMLCSAQDYRPGQLGRQEHVWQATMAPDAVVFVTHPACASHKGAYRPGFWVGNRVLPRVAQWRDMLVALYRLPQDDWMGFTHAYFPTFAFDEYVLREGWAFARKGDENASSAAYLALTAARGLELVKQGDDAYRELRSFGLHNVWLCQMGRTATDGGFVEFQDQVLASEVRFDGLSVRCTSLRGHELVFGWEGPLLVDGQVQPLAGFRHYENPYCVTDLEAEEMDIQFGDQVLRIDLKVSGAVDQ